MIKTRLAELRRDDTNFNSLTLGILTVWYRGGFRNTVEVWGTVYYKPQFPRGVPRRKSAKNLPPYLKKGKPSPFLPDIVSRKIINWRQKFRIGQKGGWYDYIKFELAPRKKSGAIPVSFTSKTGAGWRICEIFQFLLTGTRISPKRFEKNYHKNGIVVTRGLGNRILHLFSEGISSVVLESPPLYRIFLPKDKKVLRGRWEMISNF